MSQFSTLEQICVIFHFKGDCDGDILKNLSREEWNLIIFVYFANDSSGKSGLHDEKFVCLAKCCPIGQSTWFWEMSQKLGKNNFSREHESCQFPIGQDSLQGQPSLWATWHFHSNWNLQHKDALEKKTKQTFSHFCSRWIFHSGLSGESFTSYLVASIFFWSLTISNIREQWAHDSLVSELRKNQGKCRMSEQMYFYT